MKRPIYIAGSSRELDRIDRAYEAAEAAGFHVTQKWTQTVRDAGKANGLEPTHARSASEQCLRGVSSAYLVVFIVPKSGPSVGAMVELGWALARGKVVVVIGDDPSIFVSWLPRYHATDGDDFSKAFQEMSEQVTFPQWAVLSPGGHA